MYVMLLLYTSYWAVLLLTNWPSALSTLYSAIPWNLAFLSHLLS